MPPTEAALDPGQAAAGSQGRSAQKEVAEISPISVVVNGLAGPRCTVEACREWSILQVHEAIEDTIKVPVDWQSLYKDTEKLAWEVRVGSLVSSDVKLLQLGLLIEEVSLPEPYDLQKAILNKDRATALSLLKRRQLPGLNLEGQWLLHYAIFRKMEDVALALLARPDFTGINAKNHTGWTPLHYAALQGVLPFCRALLARADFTQLLAVDNSGWTALQWARSRGHADIVEVLQGAELKARQGRLGPLP